MRLDTALPSAATQKPMSRMQITRLWPGALPQHFQALPTALLATSASLAEAQIAAHFGGLLAQQAFERVAHSFAGSLRGGVIASFGRKGFAGGA